MLVGRSHECDQPEWVQSLPALSEPAFDISVSSREIDCEVNRRIRSGQPIYRIHTDRILALKPDLIIAQSHCEVCAVTPGDVARSGGPIPGARVLPVAASSVAGVWETIREIARALGLEERGAELAAREQARLDHLRARTAGLRRPTLVVLEWTDPIFPMGNWGPELVEIAGGELVAGNPGRHSSAIPAEQLAAAGPEYLVVSPCGFTLERASRELAVLERYSWWSRLEAVRSGLVAFCDGNLFFNRSGMTIARTAEILAEILHGLVSGEPTEARHWRWMRDVAAAGGRPV